MRFDMSELTRTTGMAFESDHDDASALLGKAAETERLDDVLKKQYRPDIQMSPEQIEVVSSAILARGPKCNLLVFGLGNDSPLWAALNRNGYTLFLENIPEWIAKTKAVSPELNIAQISYDNVTVASSRKDPISIIQKAQVPQQLLDRTWDVIIVDGPMGYAPGLPGRAIPICWAKKLASAATHIFIDDYDRELEAMYADFLFADKRHTGRAVISRPASRTGSAGSMLWIIGTSLAFASSSAA